MSSCMQVLKARSPGRGVLIVLVSAMDLSSVPEKSGSYLAPPGVGSLHIMSFQGSILTVHATTGEAFYLDAESRAFTDANGNPVVTDTPTANADAMSANQILAGAAVVHQIMAID